MKTNKYVVKCYRRGIIVRMEEFDKYASAKHFYLNAPGIGSSNFGKTGLYDKVTLTYEKTQTYVKESWERDQLAIACNNIIDSADDTGCRGDRIVVSRTALNKLAKLMNGSSKFFEED